MAVSSALHSAPARLGPRDGAVSAPRSAVDRHWQIRLVIMIPVLLMLFTIIFGLISYLSFSSHWDELVRAGVYPLASQLLRTHLTTMIILTIVAGLMGMALSVSILRPVRAIEKAVAQVAAGKLDEYAQLPPAAPELTDLSLSFNAMLDQLNNTIRTRDRQLLEGIPIGILSTDLAGRITAASPAAALLLGLAPERLVGRTLLELAKLLPSTAQPLARDMVAMHDGSAPHESHELTLKPNLDESNASERTVIAAAAWLRDAAQEPTGLIFSFRDATPLRALSEHFGQTDRLAALGTFCLGLAHELRNPLGALKGLAQLLQLERDLAGDTAMYLTRMVHEVDRVDGFVQQLLTLSTQPSTLVPTDLASVLDQAGRLARREVAHGDFAGQLNTVRFEQSIEPLPPLLLESDRLAQAFAKILQNAWEFTPDGGTITLAAAPVWDGAAGRCEVRVHNTGSVLAPGLNEKLFEPFVTTRDHATGLGLTIARQIIHQNGGTLEAREEAHGVAFVASFNMARAARAGELALPEARGGAA